MIQNPYESPVRGELLHTDQPLSQAPSGPSPALFRAVAVATLTCWFASVLLPALGIVAFSSEIANARSWNYFGAILPFWAVQVWSAFFSLSVLVGIVGALCFWRVSRWVLAAAVIVNLLATPFVGLLVVSPIEGALASIAGAMLVWLVTVSFWSPLANRFRSVKPNPTSTPV